MNASPHARRTLLAIGLALVALGAGAPGAGAEELEWRACGDAGAECATVPVPRDYAKPNGRTLDIAITRVKATERQQRIGSLFFNLGGRGRRPRSTSSGSAQGCSTR
jgi:hypothetical protein